MSAGLRGILVLLCVAPVKVRYPTAPMTDMARKEARQEMWVTWDQAGSVLSLMAEYNRKVLW